MHKTTYTQVATESPTSQSDDNLTFENASNNSTVVTVDCVDDLSTRTTVMKRRKKWEIFPGRNMFCCDGFIITSQQQGIFYLTCFLIIGTSVLFFVFDCPFLAVELSMVIPVIGGLMFIFVMATLFRTSFSDPGIIPRATKHEAMDIEKQIELSNLSSGATSYKPPPRARDVVIRGQTVRLKYCFTCKIFRPPRASHCSVCDNCVERFDHHCPWVGNCVGLRNYRYFYMFLLSLSLLCLFIFSNSVAHLFLISRENGLLDAFKKSPASVVEAFICFFSVWSVIGLTGFHTYLAGSNLTTNEDMKGTYSSKHPDTTNPYSNRSLFQNYCFIVCGPLPPSVIDRRGVVQSEGDDFQPTMTANHCDTDENDIRPISTDDDGYERSNKLNTFSAHGESLPNQQMVTETSLITEVKPEGQMQANIPDVQPRLNGLA